jgi:hypothetical protein
LKTIISFAHYASSISYDILYKTKTERFITIFNPAGDYLKDCVELVPNFPRLTLDVISDIVLNMTVIALIFDLQIPRR